MNSSGSEIFEAGTVLGKRYEVLGIMQRNENYFLYAARDVDSHKKYCLKVLHTKIDGADDRDRVWRFQNDARSLSRFKHANILRVYDFMIAESGESYTVAEYLAGRDLHGVIVEDNGISYDRAMYIWAQICNALQYAHSNGVILRELTPQNIFLTKVEAEDDLAKIIDMSMAVRLDDMKSPLAPIVSKASCDDGSPCYMSPELLSGAEVDARSDVFSLGCVMYETMMAKAPFTVAAVKSAVAGEAMLIPTRFSDLRPDLKIPIELENIIRRALEGYPRDRYENMESFKNAFVFVQGNQSIAKIDSILGTLKSRFTDQQ